MAAGPDGALWVEGHELRIVTHVTMTGGSAHEISALPVGPNPSPQEETMKRWTAIPMMLLIWACNQKGQGTVSGAISSARATSDSALAGARANADTAMAGVRANADTALGHARGAAEQAMRGDTSTTPNAAPKPAGKAGTSAKPPSGEAAMSPAKGANFDLSGLSSDQIKELQNALNNAGCKAGPVDGIVGPRTQHGIACGMEKNNITGQDPKALYQALHLNF